MPRSLLLFLLSLVVFASSQNNRDTDPFRTELFPEQLEQQRVQFRQQELQLRLGELMRFMQVSTGERLADLLRQQSSIQGELGDLQLEQLRLQEEIQKRLGNPVNFPRPDQRILNRPGQFQGFVPQQPQPQQNFQQPQQNFQQQEQNFQRPQQPNFQEQEENFQRPQQPNFQQPQEQNFQRPQQPNFQQPQEQNFQRPQQPQSRPTPEDDFAFTCTMVTGEEGVCRPLIKCLAFYADLPDLRKQPCSLGGGERGVCCPTRERPQGPKQSGVLVPPRPPPVVVPDLTPEQLNEAALNALQALRERFNFVSSLFAQGIFIRPNTPTAWHLEFFPTSNTTLEKGEDAQKNVEATTALVNQFNLSPEQGTFALPKFSLLNTVIGDTCPVSVRCPLTKYRSPDGRCNNLANSEWGKAGTALQRVLPPKYTDGVSSPRSQSSAGQPLPSARVVSTTYAVEADRSHDNYTMMVMQWGQFLDHDLTHTPISRGVGGSGISCCREGEEIEVAKRHPECFAIQLPKTDKIFSPFGERCMEFSRSLPAPRPECNFGPREQMNQITGHLDGSNVYGSSGDSSRNLREGRGGKLKVQTVRGRRLLPANSDECTDDLQQLACFAAGDGRVNEQVDLALMHTVWMREHNRLAGALQAMHPDWNDETLYQEARRILVAEIQHITYNEFLPVILGRSYMDKSSMAPKDEGWTNIYDANLNPSITNVFATAAFRFGHSLIQSHIHGYGRFGNLRQNFRLSKQHFAPFDLYNSGAMDDLIRGLTAQTSQKFDRFFTKELTDHLFQGDLDIGLDLFALNVQRGRDHGLPPYNDWREVCGLSRANTWQQMADILGSESVTILSRLYPSPEEVDLFVGAVSETPLEGAMLGPTFVCLVGDQFARLRRGDRFFYEESNQPSSFSQEQLKQIRKTSLARVLCDNSDDIALMQPLVFIQPSFLNQRVACNSQSIPSVDLSAWANERPASA